MFMQELIHSSVVKEAAGASRRHAAECAAPIATKVMGHAVPKQLLLVYNLVLGNMLCTSLQQLHAIMLLAHAFA